VASDRADCAISALHRVRPQCTSKVSSNDSGPARARVSVKTSCVQNTPTNSLQRLNFKIEIRAYLACRAKTRDLRHMHGASSTINIVLRAYYS
jgi:hypothetical protein